MLAGMPRFVSGAFGWEPAPNCIFDPPDCLDSHRGNPSRESCCKGRGGTDRAVDREAFGKAGFRRCAYREKCVNSAAEARKLKRGMRRWAGGHGVGRADAFRELSGPARGWERD